MKIKRIRFYHNPQSSLTFNQSAHIVTIETDQGITGIGEGGSVDTIRQCGAMIIGEDPFRTDPLWQVMYRGYFYPAGREKLDALVGFIHERASKHEFKAFGADGA